MLSIVTYIVTSTIFTMLYYYFTHVQDLLAPNVIAMIQSFNQLALLVPSEILEETTPQARAKVITSYIQVSYRSIDHFCMWC